ncbi:hypothetical protein MRX96_035863 [Rhipicephalus microplus]
MYSCSLCAYSSCGKAHLAIHAYHEHRDVQPVPWHSKDSILPQPSQSETKYLVRPKEYICGLCKQQCRFRCLTTVMFRGHLEEHHCGSVAYDCHLCLTRASSPGVLLEHYRCDHAYFNVHCLYCDFGKEDDWVVMRHIMEKHPDKPFRLLLRNGDSAAVVQELQKLVEEYLSRDPVPQPFLSGSSQIEPCTRLMQQTPDISRKSNNRPTSSDQLCTIELVPFKTTENILLNNSENEQRTVWKFEDGKIVEVGKLVAPSWVHEAQCYLKLTCRARLTANGKTMIKNLKTAIDYVTSAVLSNEVEQQQRETTSSNTDDQSVSTTPEAHTQCPAPMVDSLYARATGSHSFQGKALHEPPSVLDNIRNNGIDRSLEESNHSRVLSRVPDDLDIMSSIPQLLECLSAKTPFCTKTQRSVNGKVHMEVLSSVYIDASFCKKVNGNIVVEEEVLQNLATLKAMHVHKNEAGSGPDSVLFGAHARSHVCSVCLISFGTFEDLCKHFAEMHENSSRDSASAISLQGNWKLQRISSISNTIRNAMPSPSGDAQLMPSNSKISLHFKQMESKHLKASIITDNVIRVGDARVPYSELASVTNLNPVVRMVELPVVKREPS